MMKQLTTVKVVNDHIQVSRSLEGVVEINDEWVVDAFEHSVFGHGVLHGIALDNVALGKHLHGVNFAGILNEA